MAILWFSYGFPMVFLENSKPQSRASPPEAKLHQSHEPGHVVGSKSVLGDAISFWFLSLLHTALKTRENPGKIMGNWENLGKIMGNWESHGENLRKIMERYGNN